MISLDENFLMVSGCRGGRRRTVPHICYTVSKIVQISLYIGCQFLFIAALNERILLIAKKVSVYLKVTVYQPPLSPASPKSKDELRDLIDSALRGTSAFYDIAKAEMWARHEITPPVDVFDGIHVLQFDKASESHLIWYSTSGNAAATTHELMLPCGTVDCVLRQLRELLEAMLQFIEET